MALKGRTAVIIDRQPLWLEALGDLLTREGVEVLATTTDSVHGFDLVREHEPEMLVLDVEATDENDALALVSQAKALQPEIKVVVVSSLRDTRLIAEALQAGASAYCLKSAGPADLTAGMRQSMGQQSIYLPPVAQPHALAAQGDLELKAANVDLTKRELEILRLVAEGHSNSQLAKMLWVTEQTVKFHLSNIYRKLSVANRTEASRWAQRHGVLTVGDDTPTAVHSAARTF
jgi:DNA-binding NarL/FixJ family response regulator